MESLIVKIQSLALLIWLLMAPGAFLERVGAMLTAMY